MSSWIPKIPKSSTSTPSQTEALLRKLLLANDINDVHFHLLSRRSKSRALDPRVLNANTTLLKSSSKYFADLFSSDSFPSDTAMMKVKATDKILDGVDLSEYGYESDSDLEDDTDITASPAQTQVATGSDSDDRDSDTLVLETTPSLEKYYDSPQQNVSHAIGLSSWRPASEHPTWAVGGGRHIFVKDTAFQTWYCLLHFFYMGTTEFSLLKSSRLRGSERFSSNASQVPKCSAKSMYRLATKLSIDKLRDRTFTSICSSVDENNLLQELASGFTGRHPAVLDMELDLLLEKIACAPVVEGLPKLMARISRNELSHGADIMAGFYTRILQKHYLTQLPTPSSAVPSPPEPIPDDLVVPLENHSFWRASPPILLGAPQQVPTPVLPIAPRTTRINAPKIQIGKR
ncbi:hypothetical protein PISMIDRAFT_689887 [Pisolithus microcarpus 441]|uniref:BTB domain-containing protein n=1 Tax=Pisolithus microcarpus 441 TaxID=765257 RepID=A0A0C9YVZ0_9AGAM|nr:hypothetical protein BKA83DRAFT_689887 [Pisolithus microcarpus]KIK12008.1 hypothetical protein PISMIDRAFT_689887 [Pisolithus microcarpus 441]